MCRLAQPWLALRLGAPSAASTGFPTGTAKNISPEVTGSFTPTVAGACVAATVAGTCVCCAGATTGVCAGGEATTVGGADTNWLIDVAPVLSGAFSMPLSWMAEFTPIITRAAVAAASGGHHDRSVARVPEETRPSGNRRDTAFR